eukprot:GEZU01020213.1.p2 GENE.GEZU01020213.1~~GEZU01020213.1.p2  ORF type:complete len:186 (-),score=36.00 GEZU01020213.1:391-948(-)
MAASTISQGHHHFPKEITIARHGELNTFMFVLDVREDASVPPQHHQQHHHHEHVEDPELILSESDELLLSHAAGAVDDPMLDPSTTNPYIKNKIIMEYLNVWGQKGTGEIEKRRVGNLSPVIGEHGIETKGPWYISHCEGGSRMFIKDLDDAFLFDKVSSTTNRAAFIHLSSLFTSRRGETNRDI